MKKQSLISDSILYAIATGLNRGTLLLIFPILLTFLTIEEYGIFTLIFTISQMLIPFLTISGTAGIIREGANNISIGVFLLQKFINIVFFNLIVLLIIFYFFDYIVPEWVIYSILFGAINALYELFFAFYRIINNKKLYFIMTLLKSIVTIFAIIVAKYNAYTLPKTFQILILSQMLIVIYLIIVKFKKYKKHYNTLEISTKNVLSYTIFIIPHGFAIWAMNNIDKFIIKEYLDNTQLGIYSIAYTIASLQMFINAGIAITLPQNIYKNYEYWLNFSPRFKVLIFFSGATFILSCVLLLFLKIDQKYFHFFRYYQEILNILLFVMPALFLVGIYQFYSIYIFYFKKTKNIVYIGIIGVISNIILNSYMIPIYGIIGAAISTLLTYIIYLLINIFYVIKIEPILKNNIFKELLTVSIVLMTLFLLFYFSI